MSQIAALTPRCVCSACGRTFLRLADGSVRRHKCGLFWTGYGPAAAKRRGL